MKIDPETGNIALPEIDAVITRALSHAQFTTMAVFAEARKGVQNKAWRKYTLPAIPQAGTSVIIGLQFFGERLSSIDLFHDAERFGTSWENASRENELARKSFHEHWLSIEQRTPVGRYSWGEVLSIDDRRGGSSYILISYR